MNFSRKAICFMFVAVLFLTVAHKNVNAQEPVVTLTLNFDWDRDFTFDQTSITLYSDSTFTTGDGHSGFWEVLPPFGFPAVSFTFTTGCAPLYAGHIFGYMKCSNGPDPTALPGYWFLSAVTDLDESTDDS